MTYRKINASEIDALWELQKEYKAEIGEDEPDNTGKKNLADAISKETILFYGVWKENSLIGCCSVTVGFSTFDYMPSGVFEDFFIRSAYRHQGIARACLFRGLFRRHDHGDLRRDLQSVVEAALRSRDL